VESASASVEELVEEGNSFEASIVDGVENAKDPDVLEVTTRQVPEDDVPEEYRNDNDRVASGVTSKMSRGGSDCTTTRATSARKVTKRTIMSERAPDYP
jgi:hypothetical protein